MILLDEHKFGSRKEFIFYSKNIPKIWENFYKENEKYKDLHIVLLGTVNGFEANEIVVIKLQEGEDFKDACRFVADLKTTGMTSISSDSSLKGFSWGEKGDYINFSELIKKIPTTLVECIDQGDYQDILTIGESYIVIDETNMWYEIILPNGGSENIPKRLFKILN